MGGEREAPSRAPGLTHGGPISSRARDDGAQAFATLRLETELVRAFDAAPGGNAPTLLDRKADAIAALLGQLSSAERSTLAARIVAVAPSDALASAFHRPSHLGRERMRKLRDIVDGKADAATSGASQMSVERNEADTSPSSSLQGSVKDGADRANEAFNAKQTNQLSIAARAGVPITAPGFLHLHMPRAARAAHLFLVERAIPTGDPQVSLRDGFYDLLFEPFASGDIAANLMRLRTWIAPDDLYALVDRNRPIFEDDEAQDVSPRASLDYEQGPKGPAHWSPSVGTAIGSLLEARLRESFARMSPRLVAATARNREAAKAKGHTPLPVEAKDLVTSHPLDWHVALAMVGHGAPGVTVKDGALNARDDISTSYRPVHRVEWLSNPWPAVQAVEPADATIEEMAAFVLGRATDAYRLRRVGNIFLVPEDVASVRPDAVMKRPATRGPSGAGVLAYGDRAAAVETAEVERAMKNDVEAKAPDGANLATLQTAWTRIDEQLTGIGLVVRPLGLDVQLVGAVQRHKAHQLDLGALKGRDALIRAELFARQEILLTKIAADIGAVVSDSQKRASGAKAAKGAPKVAANVDSTRTAALKLVTAAGYAHLPETGEAFYAEAHAARRDLLLTTFEAQLGDIATQLEIARLSATHAGARGKHSASVFKQSLQERADGLRQRLAALRSHLLAGTADATEIEAIYAGIESLQFEAGVIAGVGQLGEAFKTLDELTNENFILLSEGLTASITDNIAGNPIGRLETNRRLAFELRGDLQTIHSKWLKVQMQAIDLTEKLQAGGVKNASDQALALVAPQLAIIKGDLAKLGGNAQVHEFLNETYDRIKSAERRALIVRLAAMIGLTIVANAVGTAFVGVATGLGASPLAAAVVGVTAETTTFTLLDAKLSGHPIVHAFVSNFAGNFATFAAIRGVSAKLAGTAIGRTLAKSAAGERVAVLSKLAANAGSLTATTLVAVGIQFAQAQYESLLKTGKTMSLDELKMAGVQGIAMMIGAAISHKMLDDGMQELKALGIKAGAHFERRMQMRALAEKVTGHGDPTGAMDLLHQVREQLELEMAEARGIGELTDKQLAERGLSRPVVDALAKRTSNKLADLDKLDAGTMTAQLGLDTVVPGQVYAGDPAAVKRVTDLYRARGYRVEAEGRGRIVVGPDGQVFHILEREAPGPNRPERSDGPPTAVGSDTTPGPSEVAHADETISGTARPEETQRPQTENPTEPTVGRQLGAEIASRVPGVHYERGGIFMMKVGDREVAITIRRTSGQSRIVHEGESVVLEVPKGLDEQALAAAVVAKLGEVREGFGPPVRGESSKQNPDTAASSRQSQTPNGSERPAQDTGLSTLTDVDPSNDVARIQTKALNAAIEDGSIKLDWTKKNKSGTTSLGQEYKKWIESPTPVDFSGKEPKANYNGDPEFAGEIAAIVKKGNVTLNLRAQANAEAAAKLELKSLDPASATYGEDRAKLVEKFGPDAVARYEQATLGDRSDPARKKIFEQVDNVVGPAAIDQLRNAFPGYEIYITGSASQPTKGAPADLATIADLDVMIVVPESVDAAGRSAIEAQAKAMSVPTAPEFADATGRKSLPIDATARTKTQAFGVMTTATPKDPTTGKSRTPLEYARVDANVVENVGEVRSTTNARQSQDAQSSNSARAKPTEAEAARKVVVEKYKDLTASDFTGVDDPRLREIQEAARDENREVAARLGLALEKAGVKDFEIQFRAKSLKSILGKLQETPGMRIQDIKDLSGVRVNITRVNEANFAQYDRIKETIQREFGMPEAAIKDYNKKPNPWGYTGRVHMFEIGGAEIYSEIQVGSRDLSEFIEKKFSTKDGKAIELHDLTGYKGQLYGKSIPPELQTEYTRIFGLITSVNKGGSNLADVPAAKAEVDAYFAKVQAFLDTP